MKYFVLDLETSGLKPGFHEITEVSILRCEDLVQKVWLLNVHHPNRFDKQALMVTGQDVSKILQRKQYLEDIIPEVNAFLQEDDEDADGRVIIAHGGAFDRNQIEHNWELNKSVFPANYWLDTVQMSKKFIKKNLKITKKQSATLSKLLELFEIKSELQAQHTAEVDVRNTFRIFKYLEKRGMNKTEFTKLSPRLISNDMKKIKGIYKGAVTEEDLHDVLSEIDMNDIQDDEEL